MNQIVYNKGDFEFMWFKCIWLRSLAFFILVIIGPFLLIATNPLLTILFGPCMMFKELKYGIFYIKPIVNA